MEKKKWERLSEKFLSWGKTKGCEKQPAGVRFTVGVDEVPMKDEYEKTLMENNDLDELNELVYNNLIASINTISAVRNIAFGLVRNAKSPDFHKGICKVT